MFKDEIEKKLIKKQQLKELGTKLDIKIPWKETPNNRIEEKQTNQEKNCN